ncbi:MAG: EF-hand domain-containing protein [Desulfobacteraceae bacterium]
MMIGSMGSNQYSMGQMSAMGIRFSAQGMPGPTPQGPAMGGRPDPAEMFNKVDQDGSGGLDQTEFQTLAGKISEATGQEVDVNELFATYDTDGDGALSEDETHTAMEANRPAGPPPGGMMGPMGGMGAMRPGAAPDLSQIFSDADQDGDGSLDESEVQGVADMISQVTEQDIDAAELLAEFDEDGDGVLDEEETIAALEANRPEGPPPQEGMTFGSDGSGTTVSSGIERYMQVAGLGMEQSRSNDLFSMSGTNGNGNGYSGGWFNSVNTWS